MLTQPRPAISYLRAIIATREHSPRALALTAHIIDLNPAHYTVWLFRASTLFALNSSLTDELSWVNTIALANQKNYQIWHHRQLLIEHLYPSLASDRSKVLDLARSEAEFMTQMFELDSKNYHVWSYRQYFVRKLGLFPSQCEGPGEHRELDTVEALLESDVRNNSAWAHRFFIVFSDPGCSTEDSTALERDEKVPEAIVDREIEFSEVRIRRAPMNQSGWNYVKGVLRKGGRELGSLEGFAREFVRFEGEEGAEKEDVKSSHALELLVDVWAEKGEVEKADMALRLLGDKYDRVRRNYWEYRREGLTKI
jgi:protein farnesyltransferase/geranylgeranyltransferase type-1 subunit alpha